MAATATNIRVPLGRTLATPGILEVTTPAERNIAFNRHARGDWGGMWLERTGRQMTWRFTTEGGCSPFTTP